ncbi:carbohydrate kinase family protein [Patescibacteria group bacterium]|nr:carbohydrate kinase family protein [Patescibacteria group bacterium]
MYDIITFGSAAKDIFLKTDKLKTASGKGFVTGKGVCFNLGSKIDIEEIFFSSGGGGTNTAATFANQGFKVAYCGAVGDDLAGKEIIEELDGFGVDTNFIIKKEKPTNHSIIFIDSKGERTAFVYRGASGELKKQDISWKKLQAKWFYIAPLSGSLCSKFGEIIDFAYKNKIKVALNPGNCQLNLPIKRLEKILKKVDILFLNQEEASFLTKVPYQKEKEIFKKLDEFCPGIVMMGNSKRGVASDGKYIYYAEVPKIKVLDRTGAGDAGNSGFVSGFIKSKGDIEYAEQLGMANNVSCLKKIGAKTGLLKKNEKFGKVKITKSKI